MKVCFFNRSYWPDHGATGQLLTELCEDLVSRHGFEVTVVCGVAPGRAPVRRERRNGVEIIRAAGTAFDKTRFAGRAANYLSYFASAWLAGRRIGRPDVVVALTDPPIIGLAARRAARRTGARFVYLCQDVFPEVARLIEDFRSRAVDAALARTGRSLVCGADRVVAVGETMRDHLVEHRGVDPARVAVIHNWADCAALTPRSKGNPFARAHGLREPFVVMHSGNVGLSQDLDTLLDAAALLREERGILFVIMGDGARRAALEVRARAGARARALSAAPAQGAPGRCLRQRGRVRGFAEAWAGGLHRPEQALRHPGRRAPLPGGRRACLRSDGHHRQVRLRTPCVAGRRARAGRAHS
jgi:glycosyltransferase involved in cell wall biosynthesis